MIIEEKTSNTVTPKINLVCIYDLFVDNAVLYTMAAFSCVCFANNEWVKMNYYSDFLYWNINLFSLEDAHVKFHVLIDIIIFMYVDYQLNAVNEIVLSGIKFTNSF